MEHTRKLGCTNNPAHISANESKQNSDQAKQDAPIKRVEVPSKDIKINNCQQIENNSSINDRSLNTVEVTNKLTSKYSQLLKYNEEETYYLIEIFNFIFPKIPDYLLEIIASDPRFSTYISRIKMVLKITDSHDNIKDIYNKLLKAEDKISQIRKKIISLVENNEKILEQDSVIVINLLNNLSHDNPSDNTKITDENYSDSKEQYQQKKELIALYNLTTDDKEIADNLFISLFSVAINNHQDFYQKIENPGIVESLLYIINKNILPNNIPASICELCSAIFDISEETRKKIQIEVFMFFKQDYYLYSNQSYNSSANIESPKRNCNNAIDLVQLYKLSDDRYTKNTLYVLFDDLFNDFIEDPEKNFGGVANFWQTISKKYIRECVLFIINEIVLPDNIGASLYQLCTAVSEASDETRKNIQQNAYKFFSGGIFASAIMDKIIESDNNETSEYIFKDILYNPDTVNPILNDRMLIMACTSKALICYANKQTDTEDEYNEKINIQRKLQLANLITNLHSDQCYKQLSFDKNIGILIVCIEKICEVYSAEKIDAIIKIFYNDEFNKIERQREIQKLYILISPFLDKLELNM